MVALQPISGHVKKYIRGGFGQFVILLICTDAEWLCLVMSSAQSGFGGVLAKSSERFPATSVIPSTVPKRSRKVRKVAKPKKAVAKRVIRKKPTVKGKKKVRKVKKNNKKRLAVKSRVVKKYQPKLFI